MNRLKISLLIAAFGIAVTGTAFTIGNGAEKESLAQEYFWYTPDGAQSLGQGEEPNNGCTALGEGCAIGYEEEPVNPGVDPHDATRAENN